MIMGGIGRYVEDLLRSRRPRRFRAGPDDAAMARAAVTLRAARPGSGAPREEFVPQLHRRLAAELGPPLPSRPVSRRRMILRTAGVAAGAAAAGAGIDHVVTTRSPLPGSAAEADALTPASGTWLTVASSADLPDGAVRQFTAGAVTGFVQRVGGRPHGVSGVCTHQGCRLALAPHPARLVCPCHGATFALDGSVLSHQFPVALAPLPRLPVREVDGDVQVYAAVPEPGP
jgi:cytochrome b6-f complex iron-sulfur subunit